MKRTYIKPAVEVVDLETTEACLLKQSWNVRDEKGEIYDPSTDHGYIIEDGKDDLGDYDPWDSSKW